VYPYRRKEVLMKVKTNVRAGLKAMWMD